MFDNSHLTHREMNRANDCINDLFQGLDTNDKEKVKQFKEFIILAANDYAQDYFINKDKY